MVVGTQSAHVTVLAAARHALLKRVGWEVEQHGKEIRPIDIGIGRHWRTGIAVRTGDPIKRGSIQWSPTQNEARDALVAKFAGDSAGKADGKRFVFAYTNADVDALNRDIRALRRERGELGEDDILHTKDGPQAFATGDRIQFTGNARRKGARDAGFTNGVVGTVRNIDGARVTVELGGTKNGKPRILSFTVGDNDETGRFNTFRHGYAGTIYKVGRGGPSTRLIFTIPGICAVPRAMWP